MTWPDGCKRWSSMERCFEPHAHRRQIAQQALLWRVALQALHGFLRAKKRATGDSSPRIWSLIFIYTPSSRGVEVSPYANVQPSPGFLRKSLPLKATDFALDCIVYKVRLVSTKLIAPLVLAWRLANR